MPTPTPVSWTLLTPPPATGGTGGATAFGGTNVSAPQLPCPIEPYIQQDLLDLFDRIFPEHYLAPLKNPGPGYEVLQSFAAVGARLSLAVERFSCGAFILSSVGGSFATGTVEIFRTAPNTEGISVTLKHGTVVESSRSGRRYFTTADIIFGANDTGPFVVPVQAEVQGYEFNEPGFTFAADGTPLAGEIDTIVTPVESAPSQALANTGTSTLTFAAPVGGVQVVSGMTGATFSPDSAGRFVTFTGAANAANNGNHQIIQFISQTSVKVYNPIGLVEGPTGGVTWQEYSAATDAADFTFQVRQPLPTGGGVDASLDAHGKDRGIPRGTGEADSDYRTRIRSLPDNISPDAFDRALQQLLLPIGGGFEIIETWDILYQTCWDAPPDVIGTSAFDPNLFCYDDPRDVSPRFNDRWLDLNDMRGAVIVTVPNYQWIRDLGMAFGPDLPPYHLVPTINSGTGGFIGGPDGLGIAEFNAGVSVFSDASVGRILTLSNGVDPHSNGDFLIVGLNGPQRALIQAQYVVAGAVDWLESTRVVDEANVDALQSDLGARAVCAYDVPSDLNFSYLQGCWDGFDLDKSTIYANLFSTLERIKAAGTSVAVEVQGQ